MNSITLADYKDVVNLFESFEQPSHKLEAYERETIVDDLLEVLDQEVLKITNGTKPAGLAQKRKLLHAVINTLPPNRLNQKSIGQLNRLLQAELIDKNVKTLEDLAVLCKIGQTSIIVWKGDITTLKVDAIVNAANAQLLGCFQPLHSCIDNAIHTAAGVQLRDDCHTIIELQNNKELTGKAKITRAYNLPSKYVLHTVGPIVQGIPDVNHARLLADCYINCLKIASQVGSVRSMAFCCISTGVFGYPQKEAAYVAVKAVNDWLQSNEHTFESIIFNVFLEEDFIIYNKLLSA